MSDEKRIYANGQMTRSEMIEALGKHSPEGLGAGTQPPEGLEWVSMPPAPKFHASNVSRHQLLAALHERTRPRTYLEIGVNRGDSLRLSRTRTIAVDPSYRITRPIACDLVTFLGTSDDFFAQPDALDHFRGVAIDLALIDGMHLAEFALRDFINTEKRSHPGGIVLLADMFPRSSLEAYRIRRTRASWTGDVFKIHTILSKYRPDLTLLPINCSSTGAYIVLGLDPASTVLEDTYAEYQPFLMSQDPQVVPDSWLERRGAYNAQALLDSEIWSEWLRVREAGGDKPSYAILANRLAGLPKDNVPEEITVSDAELEREAGEAFEAKNWALALEKYSAITNIEKNKNKTAIHKHMLHARIKLLPSDVSEVREQDMVSVVGQLSRNVRHEVATQLTAPMAVVSTAKALMPTGRVWTSYLRSRRGAAVLELDEVLSGTRVDPPLSEVREMISFAKGIRELPWEWWLVAHTMLLHLGYVESAYDAKDVAASMVAASEDADRTLVAAARAYCENREEEPFKPTEASLLGEDLAFADLVSGKTVAVVGPAVNSLQNGGRIDSADVVVRTNFIAGPSFYAQGPMLGSRTDISYYNLIGFWRRVTDITETLRRTPIKAGAFRSAASRRKAAREVPGLLSRYAPMAPDVFYGRGYALRHLVYDLSRFKPREITCFGADFYLSEKVHAKGYNDRSVNVADSYVAHDPLDTWLFLRRCRRTVNLNADAILERILEMTKEEFLRAIGARVNPRLYDV